MSPPDRLTMFVVICNNDISKLAFAGALIHNSTVFGRYHLLTHQKLHYKGNTAIYVRVFVVDIGRKTNSPGPNLGQASTLNHLLALVFQIGVTATLKVWASQRRFFSVEKSSQTTTLRRRRPRRLAGIFFTVAAPAPV
jgi:hypothetical protein